MASVLLTWELGGGLGHLQRLRAIGVALAGLGHSITAAVRELGRGEKLFQGSPIRALQAPITVPERVPYPQCLSYGHLLHNVFLGPEVLRNQIRAWDEVVAAVRPALVVCDHSPTALLALRGKGIPVATVGTGFCSPPVREVLPLIQPWEEPDLQSILRHERELLGWVNQALSQEARPPLPRLPQLYQDVAQTCLLTFPELDHFGTRPGGRYLGTPPSHAESPADFPPGPGPKVFVYVEGSEGVTALLERLRDRGWPTLVVASPLSPDLPGRIQGQALHWARGPVDIQAAAAGCDFAISNVGHGVMSSMLLAGKPLLMLPLSVEQLLGAHRVLKLGAGLLLDLKGENAEAALDSMAGDPSLTAASRAFAARHRDHDGTAMLQRLAHGLEGLLGD
ncbi:MAG: hypothetical protein HY823_02575 [Acidobacteria bacterium]|nr:hypothetical protein [Acidobacteriota bacterium]